GHIDWSKGPMKNVCKTPLVAGQWVKGDKWKYDLIVVANTEAPEIPVKARPIAIPY
ncbi:MAG: ABC transporter substrate-binding protein, partial [Hyphomicrobiales bacterium]|nr:ABC transporter substrate-binding protein [Hyphomicrobiales bacterium]